LVPHLKNYRWFVLVLTLATTAIGMMTFAAAFPLLNLWVRELGISRTQAGVMTGLWYFAGMGIALPAGWWADRVSLRRLFLAFWTLNIAGTFLMAEATGFWMLCAGRLIFSIGTTGHLVAAPKLLSIWFQGRRELGLIMGFFSMSMTVGVYASLFFLGRIGEHSGSRAAMLLLVALTSCGFLMMLFLPSRPFSPSAERAAVCFRPLHLGLAAWIFAVAYGGYNVATEAYLTFTPDYLVRCGYGLAAASAVVGIYAWVALGLKPFLSAFLRKNNAVFYILVASLLFVLSVILLLTRTLPPALSAGVLGVSMALAMPAFYTLPPLMFENQKCGQVYGLCELCYGLGAIAQPLVGLTIDKTGHYTAGYEVICGFASLSVLGAFWLVCKNLKVAAAAVSTQKK
jgi:MFS family permease